MDDEKRKGLLERLTSRAGMLEVGIPLTFLCTSPCLENCQEVFAGNFFYFGDYCGASCAGLLFQREFKEGYRGNWQSGTESPQRLQKSVIQYQDGFKETLTFKKCFPGNNFFFPQSGWLNALTFILLSVEYQYQENSLATLKTTLAVAHLSYPRNERDQGLWFGIIQHNGSSAYQKYIIDTHSFGRR